MSVEAVIFSHHSRAPMASSLLDRLNASLRAGDALRLVTDFEGLGHWGASRRGWESMSLTRPWCLLLEDDVEPCDDFFPTVARFLERAPADVVSLFGTKRELTAAYEAGSRYLLTNAISWAQGIAVRSSLVPEMLEWNEREVDPAYPHGCVRVSLWQIARGRSIAYTVPSLVQHRLPNESTLHHRAMGANTRVSPVFRADAGALDWDEPKPVKFVKSWNENEFQWRRLKGEQNHADRSD